MLVYLRDGSAETISLAREGRGEGGGEKEREREREGEGGREGGREAGRSAVVDMGKRDKPRKQKQ